MLFHQKIKFLHCTEFKIFNILNDAFQALRFAGLSSNFNKSVDMSSFLIKCFVSDEYGSGG